MRKKIAGVAALCAAAGLLSCVLPAGAEPPEIVGSVQEFNLGGLTDGIVVALELGAGVPGEPGVVVVPMMELKELTLLLQPISIRAAGYELRAQLADGSWEVVDPGAERTYTGRAAEIEGSEVAASILPEGLFASIYLPDGTTRWVQPLSEFVAGAPANLHVVYRGSDTVCEGSCAVGPEHQGDGAGGAGGVPRGGCGGSICVGQLALDADFEYFQARGSSIFAAQDRMACIVNVVNHQYVREVQITHVLTTVLVRTAEPDPYSSTEQNALLNELRNQWEDNHDGLTRDTTHLFTGKNVDGTTIGLAWVGVICDDDQAYGFSQSDFSNVFACQTDVTAHELGHNWGANHCTCPTSTMNPTNVCANTFFGAGSIATSEIDAHADSRSCLTGNSGVPANDVCTSATIIFGNGTVTGSNAAASTDGGALSCGTLGGGTNDVWWQLTPPISGIVRLDTCGSEFDTILSVHSACPGSLTNLVVCNDDCGGSPCPPLDSCVSFSGVGGQTYYIRVAGFGSSFGAIQLNVSAPLPFTPDACAAGPFVLDDYNLFSSLYNTTNDGSASCGASSSNRDIWYQFTAPCNGTLTLTTCGSNDFPAQDLGMDTVLSVHSACPGVSANQLACNDDSAVCPDDFGLDRDSQVSLALADGQNVRIRVSHFGGAFRNGRFELHVDFVRATHAPVVTPIADASQNCGGSYTNTTASITDPVCMSPVSWSLVTGPAGMTINASTGVVSWPSPVLGVHTVTIRASNPAGFDDESWTVTINRLAPVVNALADQATNCSLVYGGPVPSITNPGCMSPVSWSLVIFPPGMTINASTGQVSWAGPIIGTHTVTIRASNSAGFDDESWQLTISRLAPTVNPIGDAAISCGGAYTGPPPSVLIAGCMNPVSWSLVSGPAGMTINSGTGVVSWPTPVVGSHVINIRATNNAGSDDESWTLTVNRVVPVVNAIADATWEVVQGAYTGPTPALSNAGCMNPVSWTLVTGPAGMAISGAGVVSWPAPVVGSHPITIRATNSVGFDDESWTVTVGDNCPVIGTQPAPVSIQVGRPASFSVTASGAGTLSYQWRRNGVNLSNGPSIGGGSISGATTRILSISNTGLGDAGNYDVRVTNSCGSILSSPAALDVFCASDWNRDHAVNSQDFFDFITDFFGGSADFNLNGATNSQDYFDFLTRFFAGC